MGLLPLPLSLLLAMVPGAAAPVSAQPESSVPMAQEAFETVLVEGGLRELTLACEDSARFGANERLQLLRARLKLCSFGAGSKHRQPCIAQTVGNPCSQRGFRSDDHQVDRLLTTGFDQAFSILFTDRQ